MAQVQCQIDSIRVGVACFERTLILRQKGTESYLPIWTRPSEAEVLADQLHGRPDKDVELDLFLVNNNAVGADTGGAAVHLEGATFRATVLLCQQGRNYEAECPIGTALALAVRANAPILVDEELFGMAGVQLS